MGENLEPRPLPDTEQPAAVARHVVRVTADYAGRGPTRARASLGDDVITVVLSDTLTKGERSLAKAGKGDLVIDMRRSFHNAMRDELIAGIEAITGRTVRAFMSDHHLDPDIAVELFVLHPVNAEERVDHES